MTYMLELAMINLHIKFEVLSVIHSNGIMRTPKCNKWSK